VWSDFTKPLISLDILIRMLLANLDAWERSWRSILKHESQYFFLTIFWNEAPHLWQFLLFLLFSLFHFELH
jgi:hypothetical protein